VPAEAKDRELKADLEFVKTPFELEIRGETFRVDSE
jgi:hypothetical protein